ncbi:MAG: HD domain-containing protein [Mesorhizobium sp.]|nr:MAG: HD domain-containing protein [Mesorhizobium sp.]RWN73232.1 MAG: HD domain-containing protein [Mesorhizobium sp.]RWN85229.1 MAG: HD domain-containing protein [Mesorhizobium sp.]RWO58157.1 MAG: HD domain-containing protein [Mesorhizobium sp.]
MQGDLATAIILAAEAHDGQVDKNGQPYILHPLRVMLAQDGNEERIAAVLHDVVEDTDLIGLGDILAIFGEEIREAVDSVTRREGEDYFDYVVRAKANPIGRQVKIADLNDNMDRGRAPAIDPDRRARMAKYDHALAFLLDKTIVKEAA